MPNPWEDFGRIDAPDNANVQTDAPAAPIVGPSQQAAGLSTPWSAIQAASNQISAGQPVTALPKEAISYSQQPHIERLQQLDNAAQNAQLAAEQAGRDADMYDQMSRVARSVKDITIARHAIDVMGLQNDIQNGVPIHEAVTRHPTALGGGFGGAFKATMPVAPTKWIPPSAGAPGFVMDPRGTPHFPPGMEQPMAKPTVEDLGQGIQGVRISPQHYQITNKPAPAPKEGSLTDIQKAQLRDIDNQAHQKRIELGQLRSTSQEYLDAQLELGELDIKRKKILLGSPKASAAPTPSAAPAAAAPVPEVRKNPDTGRWEIVK